MFQKERDAENRRRQNYSNAVDNMTLDEKRVDSAVSANYRFIASGAHCGMYFNVYTKTVEVSIVREDVPFFDRESFKQKVRNRVKEILAYNGVKKMPAITLDYVSDL